MEIRKTIQEEIQIFFGYVKGSKEFLIKLKMDSNAYESTFAILENSKSKPFELLFD